MALVYPKAEVTLTGQDGGSMLGGEPRCVWHTTETHPSAFYTAKTYYHLQIREWDGRVHLRQFIDFARASRALRHEDSVETNRRGTFCPNISIVGYAKDSPDLSDAMVNEIGELVAWCETEMGISPKFPLAFGGGEAYGYNAPGRMSADAWTAFTGHCGHQHVYRNTHWDPGRFPTKRILATLGGDMDHQHTPMPEDLPRGWADGVWKEYAEHSGTKPETRTHTFYREDLSWVWHRLIKPLEQSVARLEDEVDELTIRLADLEAGGDGKGIIALTETRALRAKLHEATKG